MMDSHVKSMSTDLICNQAADFKFDRRLEDDEPGSPGFAKEGPRLSQLFDASARSKFNASLQFLGRVDIEFSKLVALNHETLLILMFVSRDRHNNLETAVSDSHRLICAKQYLKTARADFMHKFCKSKQNSSEDNSGTGNSKRDYAPTARQKPADPWD